MPGTQVQVQSHAEDEPDEDRRQVGGQRGGVKAPSKPTEMSMHDGHAANKT